MTGDHVLRAEVQNELRWDPSVDERHISVSVRDGIVTLTGDATAFSQKWQAGRASERVAGVKGLANDLNVMSDGGYADIAIAECAAQALAWDTMVPPDAVTVEVDDGWLTLKGRAVWDFQRCAAVRAVRNIRGVRGITNLIDVQAVVSAHDVETGIEGAFRRTAQLDASRIVVEVAGSEVTLRGSVRSCAEVHEAERVAWAAPGIVEVYNLLTATGARFAA